MKLAWALAFLPASALAAEFGVGLEAGGTLGLWTYQGSTTSGVSPGAGLFLAERFQRGSLEMALWEEIQTPYTFTQVNAGPFSNGVSSSYLPVGGGFHIGAAFGQLHPYVGLLVHYNVLTSGDFVESFLSLGGNLGMEYAYGRFRFGAELRVFRNVTDVEQNAGDGNLWSATALQLLLSAQYCF
jgi:hypothetical protein